MFTNKQLSPPSKKQLSYIKSLEIKTGLIFTGSTKIAANKFIEKANQAIEERKTVSRKVERENERFPFPNLTNDLPTAKQWSYIRSLEEKSNIKFNGITKSDVTDYINKVKQSIGEN
jgi:hypothetical protein